MERSSAEIIAEIEAALASLRVTERAIQAQNEQLDLILRTEF